MPRLTKKAWFGPRKYFGWGWTPTSWEGWVTILVYIVTVVWTLDTFPESSISIYVVIILTAILLLIAFLTGDKRGGPNWHNTDQNK